MSDTPEPEVRSVEADILSPLPSFKVEPTDEVKRTSTPPNPAHNLLPSPPSSPLMALGAGGRRRSVVPVAMPEAGGEVKAYLIKVEDERNSLRAQLKEAQALEKESADHAKSFKNQLALRQSELDSARSLLTKLEVEQQSSAAETAEAIKELRSAQKDRADAEEKLAKERAELERLKAAFQEREAALLEQVKNTKKQNRDLKSHSVMMESELLTTQRATEAAAHTDSAHIHELLAAKDKQIVLYNEQINRLTSLNETLENRNISLTETLEEQLNAARSLERVNERLMEEADSYQLLLQDSTMSGDFLESAFMAKTRERGMSLSFVRGPIALPKAGGKSLADEMGGVGESEAEKHIAELTRELDTATGEIKALALYINKILGKIQTDESVEAALVKDVPDSTPEASANAPTAPQRMRGYSLRFAGAGGMMLMDHRPPATRATPLKPLGKPTIVVEEDEGKEGAKRLSIDEAGPKSPTPWLKRFSFFGNKDEKKEGAHGGEEAHAPAADTLSAEPEAVKA